jgi:hypothetical protein
MNENDIKSEALSHFDKDKIELAQDIIREANQPTEPLDRIKHTLKLMALQQLVLADQAKRTNKWLIILSVVSAFGAIASIAALFVCR